MKTYDFKQVQVIFGAFTLEGFAEGTGVVVARNNDAWNLQMGADGEGTRSKSNDKSGQIRVTLMQTSESNKILSQYALADETANAGLQPCFVKDLSGSNLHTAPKAYVKKIGDVTYANNAEGVEWVIETDELNHFIGGN